MVRGGTCGEERVEWWGEGHVVKGGWSGEGRDEW